jgi:integrase/recombinase XerD
MTPIAPHIATFLQIRLAVERRASPHTCAAYAYAFQLLFEFASKKLKQAPSNLAVERFDAPMILEFLEHLQRERHATARTRNARLAAIKSFMRFVEHRAPALLDQIRRVLAIPPQRTRRSLVQSLNADEYRAILNAPDPSERLGIRDRAMLHLALAGGLRVSELVGIRQHDAHFEGTYVHVHVRGKGRKDRALTLWKEVGVSLRMWLAVRGDAATPELFLNAHGSAMTRSGFTRVLEKHRRVAAEQCPSLNRKRVSPHVLRHTCAFNTLQATGDVRKVALWLGHESTHTTEIYLQADPTEKLSILRATDDPSLRPGKFRVPDPLLATLKAAQIMRSENGTSP